MINIAEWIHRKTGGWIIYTSLHPILTEFYLLTKCRRTKYTKIGYWTGVNWYSDKSKKRQADEEVTPISLCLSFFSTKVDKKLPPCVTRLAPPTRAKRNDHLDRGRYIRVILYWYLAYHDKHYSMRTEGYPSGTGVRKWGMNNKIPTDYQDPTLLGMYVVNTLQYLTLPEG